ncbi:hypothetical protein COLO4_36566 [Corchorus olitorius]|uniref:PB1-like domain-containing protein n=1 Tax=Corchorus olitorius TaxID=93759 RepID=A0A1R3G804_9ROSI|nr:hypothetical protein COLO4_36566 [Corchorus olitorius]
MESALTEKDAANDDYDYPNWFPHLVPDGVEEPPPMKLVFHHGGGFIAKAKFSYVIREVRVFDWWDVDKLCTWKLLNIPMSIGYMMEDINKLQYCDNDDALETAMKEMHGDRSVQFLSVVLLEKKSVDIYALHPNNGKGLKDHGGVENEEDEKPLGNAVEVDSTSSAETGDENEDGEAEVDEELNPSEVIWDNHDNSDELLTSMVKTGKTIEDEERLRKKIDELDLDVAIEAILYPEKPRRRWKAKEVYLDSSDPCSLSETGSDTDSNDARRHLSRALKAIDDGLPFVE